MPPTLDEALDTLTQATALYAAVRPRLATCPKPGCDEAFIPPRTDLPADVQRALHSIGVYPPAISREDNITEICSTCGLSEAVDAIGGTQP